MSDGPSREWLGLALGTAGVTIFSLTLPMTRLAVAELPAEVVGLGRTIPAAAVAIFYLAITCARWPTSHEWKLLAVAASGVVFGFPLFSALAMREVDASHGGVVLALLPLLTAAAGATLGGERPSRAFWLYAVAGALTVVAFAFWRSRGGVETGDVYLLIAAVLAAAGYAVGAVASRTMPGAHVISWALVVSVPALIPVGIWLWPRVNWNASAVAWGGFLYGALLSQFWGFFFWYKGLALGGIARVSQVQLLQTFLTLGFAALLLGERVDATMLGFAVLTVFWVWRGRAARVR